MSVRFLLDTDTVSYAIRGQGRSARLIQNHSPETLAMSALSLSELRYGAARRKSQRLHALIDAILIDIAVLPFDARCAETAGTIGAALAESGQQIGELDTLIAAHALSLDLTLVTNNLKHFSRIPGLKIENWF